MAAAVTLRGQPTELKAQSRPQGAPQGRCWAFRAMVIITTLLLGNRNLKVLPLMTFLLLLPAALERKAEKVLSLFCKWREQDPEKLHDLPRARRHRHKIKKVSSDSSAIFPRRRPTGLMFSQPRKSQSPCIWKTCIDGLHLVPKKCV